MSKCKDCVHYRDESHTPTGVGIAYCNVKESRRYGMEDGSIVTCVFEDDKCRYWKDGRQMELEV